jgi:hypothetical protein
MDHNSSEITLENLTKNFEFERISREIDECNDIEKLKEMLKCYVKLQFKTQETLSNLML